MIQQAINQGLSVASLLFTQTPTYKLKVGEKEMELQEKREEAIAAKEYEKGAGRLAALKTQSEVVEEYITGTKTPGKGEATAKTIEEYEPLPGIAAEAVDIAKMRVMRESTPENIQEYHDWLKYQRDITDEIKASKEAVERKKKASEKGAETKRAKREAAEAAATIALEDAQELKRGGNN